MNDPLAPDDAHATDSLREFGKALDRLGEALQRDVDTDPLVLDATIQRFEFATELCWKTLKRFLEAEGEMVKTPRQTLQKAYKAEWISDEALWLAMLDDRNKTSHTYREELARQIYAHIPGYFSELTRLRKFLLGRSIEG